MLPVPSWEADAVDEGTGVVIYSDVRPLASEEVREIEVVAEPADLRKGGLIDV